MKKHIHQRNHSLYEVFRIMIAMLSRDGPFDSNLKDVVAYCHSVRNDTAGSFTTVIDSEGLVDFRNFLDTFSNEFKCRIISYKGQRRDNDTVDIMSKLNRFLQENGLANKNVITFNFPADNNELVQCKVAGLSPSNVIEVIAQKESESVEENKVANDIKRLTVMTTNNDIQENSDRLKQAINNCTHKFNLNLDKGFHLQRIILLGQIGSGRKTQSRLLAKRMNLVFLDFRVLLLEYAKLNKHFDERLAKVRSVHHLNRKLKASILFERITKRDCLENGWILVGYVSSVTDLEVMEKQFFIIPSKIVFIHCRQHLCLDRLRARVIRNAEVNEERRLSSSKNAKYAKLGFLDLYSSCCAINHIVTEIDHFCRNRRSILKYCQDGAKYIAHIDGEHSVSTVTTLLWGQLEKFNL